MASASDIAEVRRNTDEPDDTNGYTDVIIGGYVDAASVAGASAKIWEEKSAKYVSLVDVTEAGASHKFSDLTKHAEAKAIYWHGIEVSLGTTAGRVKVRKIVRS